MHRSIYAAVTTAIAIAIAIAGCGTSEGTADAGGRTDASGTAAMPSETSTSSGTTGAPPNPGSDGPCAELLACADADPTVPAGPIQSQWGPDGLCWLAELPQSCDEQCSAQLQALRATGSCGEAPADTGEPADSSGGLRTSGDVENCQDGNYEFCLDCVRYDDCEAQDQACEFEAPCFEFLTCMQRCLPEEGEPSDEDTRSCIADCEKESPGAAEPALAWQACVLSACGPDPFR